MSSSAALYRTWRSQTFGDLLGQEAVTQTLRHAYRDGRLAHAYVFTGPRGTGKTSAARLVAMLVNCAAVQDGEPCGTCASCQAIRAGNSREVIEIDAASHRGIDDVRSLRDRVGVVPPLGQMRVFILDEAHMLTTEACNALLKTLEEPPPRVLFILATTEVHKLPTTIMSRCQPLHFRRVGVATLRDHLRHVGQAEGITLAPDAADALARAANGGVRDALSLLDQARAFGGGAVTAADVRSLLGWATASDVDALIMNVATGDVAAGLRVIDAALRAGVDALPWCRQIMERWRAIVLQRAGADVGAVLEMEAGAVATLTDLAASFPLSVAATCARIWSDLVDLAPARRSSVAQLPLELAFLATVDAMGGATTRVTPPVAFAVPAALTVPVAPPPAPVAVAPVAPASVAPPVSPPAPAPVQRTPRAVPADPAFAPVLNGVAFPPDWSAILRQAQQVDPRIGGLLRLTIPTIYRVADRATLWLEPLSGFALTSLRRPAIHATVAAIVALVVAVPVEVITLDAGQRPPADLAASVAPPLATPAPASDIERAMADPLVAMLVARTDATIRVVKGAAARELVAAFAAAPPAPQPNKLGARLPARP